MASTLKHSNTQLMQQNPNEDQLQNEVSDTAAADLLTADELPQFDRIRKANVRTRATNEQAEASGEEDPPAEAAPVSLPFRARRRPHC